jgi:hypothetical protein
VFGVVCHVAPKTSILVIGGSLKNSQDDVMSAFFADFERSSADLTAMHRVDYIRPYGTEVRADAYFCLILLPELKG